MFNCNVGHIANFDDWVQSNRWNYRMMKQLAQDPHAGRKGFVSDLVCEFPNIDSSDLSWRQFNFSAWHVTVPQTPPPLPHMPIISLYMPPTTQPPRVPQDLGQV